MKSFLSAAKHFLQSSTSIIGVAVAVPSFAAAATGQITWKEAAIPILGAVIAFIIPQHVPVGNVTFMHSEVDQMALAVAQVASATGTPEGKIVALAVPEVVAAIDAAYNDWVAAGQKLQAAKKAGLEQSVALQASLDRKAPSAPLLGYGEFVDPATGRVQSPAKTDAVLAMNPVVSSIGSQPSNPMDAALTVLKNPQTGMLGPVS